MSIPSAVFSRQPSGLRSDDRLIVSEPFSDLPGVWHEIPDATAVTVRRGGVLERQPFRPRPGAAAVGGHEVGGAPDA
jgi:hypothetical protein